MKYCIGIKTKEGVVLAADSRTYAGLDNVNIYSKIKKDINVIFDVGSRYDSEFSNFGGEVHYFEPVEEFIKKLSVLPNSNKVSKFNNFGLGSKNEEKYYYDSIQSFNARTKSLPGVIQEKKINSKLKQVMTI